MPAWSGDLEALARLGVELVPAPAAQPRDQREVGGARDGKQLGRALDQRRARAARARVEVIRVAGGATRSRGRLSAARGAACRAGGGSAAR